MRLTPGQYVEVVLERPQKNLGVDRIDKVVLCNSEGDEITEISFEKRLEEDFFEGNDPCQSVATELNISKKFIRIRK